MARHSGDRDDLFEELRSALVRWELQIDAHPEFPLIVAGIRSDHRFSLYLGQDCCYHFDAENRLKRAYDDGLLYRTQGTTLAQLRREQSPTTSVLHRRDLDSEELAGWFNRLRRRLEDLVQQIDTQTVVLTRGEPAEESSLQALRERLRDILSAELRLAPPFPGRN